MASDSVEKGPQPVLGHGDSMKKRGPIGLPASVTTCRFKTLSLILGLISFLYKKTFLEQATPTVKKGFCGQV
jgi:hypothetical protein